MNNKLLFTIDICALLVLCVPLVVECSQIPQWGWACGLFAIFWLVWRYIKNV